MISFPQVSLSTDPLNLLSLIATVIFGAYLVYISRHLVIYETRTAENKTKKSSEELKFSEQELKYKYSDLAFRKKELKQIEGRSEEIANKISRKLIDDPTWLDRFMEKTGATYGGSIFGDRISHFYYEKQQIAINCLKHLDNLLKKNPEMKYCLLIDSGTTLYHFFVELCEKMKDEEFKERWVSQVCIVTNNLPGIQYLMKNCKDGPSGEYSEIAIQCFLLPGKPLSVYGAVTGDEACEWLKKRILKKSEVEQSSMDATLKRNRSIELCESPISQLEIYLNNLWKISRDGYEIISLMSANYIVRKPCNDRKDRFYPVARGEGHTLIKYRFSEVSDKIFILSPLTKFSFATADELNKENKLEINEFKSAEINEVESAEINEVESAEINEVESTEINEVESAEINGVVSAEINGVVSAEKFKTSDKAKGKPSNVKYNLIKIKDDDIKCTFFTTRRVEDNLFYVFGEVLVNRLKESYSSRVEATPFNIRDWIPNQCQNEKYHELQIKEEIPHEILRNNYRVRKEKVNKEAYIWDTDWINH